MTARIELTYAYPVPAPRLWELVTDFDALAIVCAGYMHFTGLPQGQLYRGQVASVQVSLFGKLPPQDYRIEVIEMDETAMRVRSLESGAGVKSWKHSFQVVATETGAELREKIEIDAGWLSPLFRIWAGVLYRGRHKPRLKLLGVG